MYFQSQLMDEFERVLHAWRKDGPKAVLATENWPHLHTTFANGVVNAEMEVPLLTEVVVNEMEGNALCLLREFVGSLEGGSPVSICSFDAALVASVSATAHICRCFPKTLGFLIPTGDALRAHLHSSIRAEILQPDPLTLLPRPGFGTLMRYIANEARITLNTLQSSEVNAEIISFYSSLNALGLLATAEQIKLLLFSTLHTSMHEAIQKRFDEASEGDEPYSSHSGWLDLWRSTVATPFVGLIWGQSRLLSTDQWPDEALRSVERVSTDSFIALGRKLISQFFSIIIDYPESKPALEDLRECVHRCPTKSLVSELTAEARRLLAFKLHSAGTQTDDIITVLIATIRSLCVVFPSRDQGAGVYAVISDTLVYLRTRRDVVRCIVKSLTDPSADDSLAEEYMRFANDKNEAHDDNDDESAAEIANQNAFASPTRTKPFRTGFGRKHYRKPNALRLLLSAVPITAIISEYKATLGAQLLAKKDFAVEAEEKVAERMKCLFGEDVLAECTVMIKDMHASRRTNLNVRDRAADTRAAVGDYPLDMTIISHRKWPSMDPEKLFPSVFTPHPLLKEAFANYAALYQKVKPNMQLQIILSQGIVSLEVVQFDVQKNATLSQLFDLNLLVASVVLHLQAFRERISIADLRVLLGVSAAEEPILVRQLQIHHPTLLLLDSSQGGLLVSLQRNVVTACSIVEEAQPDTNPAPKGISQEQIAVLSKLTKAMLKTAKAGKHISMMHNSLKTLGSFTGSIDELRSVLDYLVSEGVLLKAGDNYSLVK